MQVLAEHFPVHPVGAPEMGLGMVSETVPDEQMTPPPTATPELQAFVTADVHVTEPEFWTLQVEKVAAAPVAPVAPFAPVLPVAPCAPVLPVGPWIP